ncbi:hypothetical protein AB0B25_04580 [Nocardia sp. NPDC049190]|uniref:hypothetical protein n=1 Tax=Nocardia sp. NPDC049190 TaxID=3155650 RepID=UPI003404427A
MSWRPVWDPDFRRNQRQGWLEREDGSIAMVCGDGTVIDIEPAEDVGDRPA